MRADRPDLRSGQLDLSCATTVVADYCFNYYKRLNCTYRPLSEGFVEKLVDLVEETIEDRDVRLVFQMGLGGGAHRHHERRS